MLDGVRRTLLLLSVCATAVSPLTAGQGGKPTPATPGRSAPPPAASAKSPDLPAMSWICPMDPDVIEDKAGKCPKCKMTLVAARLDSAFSCPVHPQILEGEPGKCRVCRRDLVPITASIYWSCAGSDERRLTPGNCPDGAAATLVRERRAHGDHNPRHGGQFFMAADNWHHVEGTYPRPGVFRLFVYDDFTRPIPPRKVAARAVTRETFDPATRTTNEIEQYPLRPAKSGRYLETQIPGGKLPQAITAKITFDTGQEFRFDFAFSAVTKEPPPGTPVPNPMMTMAAPTTPAAPAAAPAAATPTAAMGGPTGLVVSFGTVSETLPTTSDGLLKELTARNAEVGKLLNDGELAQLYVPALAAKDVAVALTDHARELAENRRAVVLSAAKRLVLAAWQIDYYGDLGDKQKLADAYRVFAAATTEISSAYAATR